MPDPAIEAAQRAWEGGPDEVAKFHYRQGEDGIWTPMAMEVAAREALKPIRKLHNCVYGFRLPKTEASKAELFCKHCQVKWPCETAKSIYAAAELP